MAIDRQIVLCVLIILVLFHYHDLSCVEGRHLRHRPSRNTNHHQHRLAASQKMEEEVVTVDEGDGKKVKKMDYNVDDFRPTAPGHSPGVGHSINN
ncbi:Precursor of CEP6 [Linum perenne]